MIEHIGVAVLLQNARELVAQLIAKRRVIEERIASPAAAPAERLAVNPGIIIDVLEVCVLSERLPPASGVSINATEDQLLAWSDIECALAAIPVAGEHHRLGFSDLEMTVRIQMRGDLQRVPMELALGKYGGGKTEQERRESQHAHRARLHRVCFPNGKL